jgi:predicted GNAT superfamily acetyltransferase
VEKASRNRGIGYQLRLEEREVCRKEGVELITWMADPLRGAQAHFAFNKLGAIATAYERNVFGELSDSANRGLATDRLAIEWWITSPRVVGVIDQEKLPHHYTFGFERMEVVTKTGLSESGMRRLLKAETSPRSDVLLFEIPVDLDRLREHDPGLARDWRVKTRDAFEALFANCYILSGFVHEAGRSFHLFEREDKASLLRRTARK